MPVESVWILPVKNGYVVTVGEGTQDQPAPQYVARDMDQLCEILRSILEDA
jgi:hypothetical protein